MDVSISNGIENPPHLHPHFTRNHASSPPAEEQLLSEPIDPAAVKIGARKGLGLRRMGPEPHSERATVAAAIGLEGDMGERVVRGRIRARGLK
jgi:hypothetical protein